jgi:hypothetical protein
VNTALYFRIPLNYESKESVDRPDDYEVVENMLLHGVASLVLVLTYHITYLLTPWSRVLFEKQVELQFYIS